MRRRRTAAAWWSLIGRAPAYARLAWRLLRDDDVPASHKGLLLAALGYYMSPVDLIPGIIPVLGQADDLAIVLASLRLVLRRLPPHIAQRHLEATGLHLLDLDRDLHTTFSTAARVTAAGARLVLRSMAAAMHLARGRSDKGRV